MHEWVLATNYKYYRQGYGTGFIGKIMTDGKPSTVLVTNYHVMISGLDDSYEEATIVTDEMKTNMEKMQERVRYKWARKQSDYLMC